MSSNLTTHLNGFHCNGNHSSVELPGGIKMTHTAKNLVPELGQERPQYMRSQFLDRKEEIARFEKLLDQVADGTAGLRRVLVFEGERGVGKSWLLQHFHTLAQGRSRVLPFLIRFEPQYNLDALESHVVGSDASSSCSVRCKMNEFVQAPDQMSTNSQAAVRQILEQIVRYLYSKNVIASDLSSGLPLDAYSYKLVRMLEDGLAAKELTFVLLIDSVYEADWGLVRGLEDYLCAPFIGLRRVAAVISGRGQPYPWINSLLRVEPVPGALQRWAEPNANDGEHAILRAERRRWLIQLIRAQVTQNRFWAPQNEGANAEFELSIEQEKRLQKIWQIAQGQPLLTIQLAGDTQGDGTKDDAILDRFAEKDLFKFLSDERREQLRPYLEALSVLDYFRETEAERMIQKYLELKGQPVDDVSGRKILGELQRTYLIRWDRQENKYFVDDTVRIVLSEWLRLHNQPIWRNLHETALQLYEKWALDYPQYRDYYKQRVESHIFYLSMAYREKPLWPKYSAS